MVDVVGSAGLPVDEQRIRDAIAEQIEQFGMDKLTSRIIREKLKETFDVDFSPHKAAVDKITMDIIENNAKKVKPEVNGGSKSSKTESESDAEVFTDPVPRKSPRKGTRKRKSSESDSDLLEVGQKKRRAAVASRLTAHKRSNGSSAESGSKAPKKAKRQNAYNVYCVLSEPLSAICGRRYMRRCDVIKIMWAYFRSNNLLDPKDKRYVLADEPLMKITKKERFLAFGIMKDLVPHITDPRHLDDEERAALEKYAEEEEARREAAEAEAESNASASDTKTGQTTTVAAAVAAVVGGASATAAEGATKKDDDEDDDDDDSDEDDDEEEDDNDDDSDESG